MRPARRQITRQTRAGRPRAGGRPVRGWMGEGIREGATQSECASGDGACGLVASRRGKRCAMRRHSSAAAAEPVLNRCACAVCSQAARCWRSRARGRRRCCSKGGQQLLVAVHALQTSLSPIALTRGTHLHRQTAAAPRWLRSLLRPHNTPAAATWRRSLATNLRRAWPCIGSMQGASVPPSCNPEAELSSVMCHPCTAAPSYHRDSCLGTP